MDKNNILKTFIKYVSLNALGMIGLSCYILADTFFIANVLGANGLAALNFSISVFSIIQGTGLMIGIGGATRYSILKSQNEDEKANMSVTYSIVLGVISGIIFILVGIFFADSLSQLLGADKSTLPFTSTYLTTILCFSPSFIINNILIAFIRNDNNPKLSMIAMLVGSFSNILLDYLFIFPLSMGMFGAAFATGLSSVISICVLSLHFIYHKNQFKLSYCKLSMKGIVDILSLGLSAFITEISSGIVLITFNLAILKLEGNIGIAAYGIVANIALVANSVYTGVAQGIQPVVSEEYGANNRRLLKQVFRYGIITSLFIALLLYAVIFSYSDIIISIFNNENNSKLELLATKGLQIYFIGFFFAGINIVTAAFLSASEQVKKAFKISIMRGCIVIVPLVLVLSNVMKMTGIWLAFVFSELIVTIFVVLFEIHVDSSVSSPSTGTSFKSYMSRLR